MVSKVSLSVNATNKTNPELILPTQVLLTITEEFLAL